MTFNDTRRGKIAGGQSNDEGKATVETRKRIKGTIVKRRVLGSHLAFCTVKLDNEDDGLSIVFRASSFSSSDGNVFPNKKSALPFGAKVDILVQQSSEATGPPWEVVEWKIVENPCILARQVARQKEGGGISCSKYLQARGDVFLSLRENDSEQVKPLRQPHQAGNKSSNEPTNHGRNKALRAQVFCNWLLDNMIVNKDVAVLDIAGGKGLLSMELARRAHVSCTVVDPLIRKRPNTKHLQKLQAPLPQYNTKPFYNDEETRASKMVASSTLLVGLHPDECTEDIVDVALSCGKSVAIVPCCVFPSLFSQRMLKNGNKVKSYDDFLQYLLEKDARLQQTTLPIDGKNQVIYLKVT